MANKNCGYLQEYITMVLINKHLPLNIKKINHIIVEDLRISLEEISPSIQCALLECFRYYMKAWPGWKDYRQLCVNAEARVGYHEELKNYLTSKLKLIMENTNMFICDDKNADLDVLDVTKKSISIKPEAPYTVIVEGPPTFLNNISFLKCGGNIIVTHHPGRPLSFLNINQLFNYPYVTITVKFLDLEFSRNNCHKIERYITEGKDCIIIPKVNFIENIEKICPSTNVKVYTLEYINAYYRQFLEIAKRLFKENNNKSNKLYEIEIACKQFTRDIQESNVETCLTASGDYIHTMATNTSVCFNIGGKTYIRNKKMSQNADTIPGSASSAINLCEILIPRVVCKLLKFTAQEDVEVGAGTFKALNQLQKDLDTNMHTRNQLTNIVNSSITYGCSWCALEFTGEKAYLDIIEHLRMAHKDEQSLLCCLCRKQYALAHLAGGRWLHDCVQKKK